MGFFITGDHLRFATRESAAPLRPLPLKPYSFRWALFYRMCLPLPCRLGYSARLSFLRLPPVDEEGNEDPPGSSTSGGTSETESWLDPSHNKPGKSCPAENFGDGGAVVVKTEATAEEIGDLLA